MPRYSPVHGRHIDLTSIVYTVRCQDVSSKPYLEVGSFVETNFTLSQIFPIRIFIISQPVFDQTTAACRPTIDVGLHAAEIEPLRMNSQEGSYVDEAVCQFSRDRGRSRSGEAAVNKAETRTRQYKKTM